MAQAALHRFERNGKRYALDPETCFCFECDEICWDVLEHYPQETVNRIYHLLQDKHDLKELSEVVGELEWLRASKSILPPLDREKFAKTFQVKAGLRHLALRIPRTDAGDRPARRGLFRRDTTTPDSNGAAEIGQAAIGLLLSRSGDERALRLEIIEEQSIKDGDAIVSLVGHASRQASLAGKTLTAVVRIEDIQLREVPDALKGHTLHLAFELTGVDDADERVRALSKARLDTLARLAKLADPGAGVTARVIVCPNHPEYGEAVRALHEAGCTIIEVDLDSTYVAHPDLSPADMLPGLSQTAVYYAEQLLKQRYFRLDPIADLFMRIYEGKPLARLDPAGTHALAVDSDGRIFPSPHFFGIEAYALGEIAAGSLDEESRSRFDDVGSLTTPACRRCWARHLCGGGTAAVHLARSGDMRRPDESWCDAQREWMAAAVAAFSMLSSAGVNFTRAYQSLTPAAKPSLFTALRAAMGLRIGMRPLEEADAELLVKWENWRDAAYFLVNEGGLLVGTQYDREMDSLHPSGLEQEFMMVRKTGESFGLLKLRPDRFPSAATAWIYIHRDEDYVAEDVRRGFRTLLNEAGRSQDLRRLTVPVTPFEPSLAQFLQAVGFEREGTQREALYLHGEYHSVDVYGMTLQQS
jgi:uncharacterized protein